MKEPDSPITFILIVGLCIFTVIAACGGGIAVFVWFIRIALGH